ncbi:MAG: fumarate hydratase [Chloroflexota bacterium]
MREIEAQKITETVARLCIEAAYELGDDVLLALKQAYGTEESELGKEVLSQILKNAEIAPKEKLPLCQDTGTAIVFLELGQEVHITGGDLYAAVDEGVRKGYTQGYLRKSIVSQPFSARINTEDNTPAVIHTDIVPGNRLEVTVLPKGAGSENMSRLGMLTPGEGREGVIDFVVRTVDEAGGKPCPPLILGVGIGGTADMALLLSKKALLRKVGEPSSDPEIASLEQEILERANTLGIGPMGFGGRITALAVHILTMPTHIAELPVGLSFQCHSARHTEATL